MARTRSAKPQYLRLEERLSLLAWLNFQFGYTSNQEILAALRDTGEGFDSDGCSYLYHQLIARGDRLKIKADVLARYDNNIRNHLEAINARRSAPITLRYFQHLALLYAEIFLDACFNSPRTLIQELNHFVGLRNQRRTTADPKDAKFTQADLKKLAFWMATGSGKTLIMHINYRQFLHYNNQPLDNILLITPNEGLSEQHIEEMATSNIPCRRFDLNESGLTTTGPDSVRVIEITKLVKRKRGGGQSVPIEAFEGNNLVFVDEGHKGSGGEAWRSFRDALGQTGFTFEYSATFGQALTAAKKDQLTEEYGKAILFDYSYRYFHGDGYGKDFRILNLKEETTEDKTEMLLLGNLLSFYQQQRVFSEMGRDLRPYNLEKPLWVFVGSSVNAVYSENKQKRSDVLTIARFLHHLLENKRGWVVKTIDKLLNGKTDLVDPDGQDVFAGKFDYLNNTGIDARTAYRELLSSVLHAPTEGGLLLCDLRGSKGELGLKAYGADDYFGLIYIGDTTAFKNLVRADDSGIVLEEDAMSDSLFAGINRPDTSIEILIGAKKFMEGWNSWRVSNMGLLNIGRKEGSEIIQLFGRGVRLRGKDASLKRSSVLDGESPEHLSLLETLNIFAVRANYMARFREYLESEGVEVEGRIELPLFIELNKGFLRKGLVMPQVPKNKSFSDKSDVTLEVDPDIRVSVDMSLKLQTFDSGSDGITGATINHGQERAIPDESLDLVDWERAYIDLMEYKKSKGMHNLAVSPGLPRAVFEHAEPARLYSVVGDDAVVQPGRYTEVERLQDTVLSILCKYTDKYYRTHQEQWYSVNMEYQKLKVSDVGFEKYTVKIPRGETQLIKDVQELIDNADSIYKRDQADLPTIHFDRHLYQPLLWQKNDKIKSEPPGLNDSERQFVHDLRRYCEREINKSLAGKEIYLLRNQGRGKGVGFFDKRGFYPDFILWIKQKTEQRIIFIEPHGMLHAEAYQHDDKASLHEYLSKLTKKINRRTKKKNITLDSYIISATPFDTLRKHYDDGKWDRQRFAEKHILFPEEDYDHIGLIIQ